ncbi:MAG TPA: T9SS type A sorting domain-containing protein [Bacteroidia bacterium]|nr:T9SS type A sorting domain-containing protein [Bacteroidia bacterium]
MKKTIFNSVKIGLLVAGIILTTGYVKAGTYTAVASGNWSSSVTWGGTPAPFNLAAGDQVTIASGITVTMDSTVTMNGLLAQISVAGTLSSSNSTSLNIDIGTLAGAGTIAVGNVSLNGGSTFSFTGNLTAQTFTSSIIGLTSAANIKVNKTLALWDALSIQTGGTLNMAAGSTITIYGGQLNLGGGTLNLSASYNVKYVSASTTTGMELSGSGLNNVNINVGTGNTVTLGANLTTSDSLQFTSGTLVLNGNTLTINGAVTGTASLTGDANANLVVNTSGGIASSLSFTSGGQTLNNFTLNIGSGNSLAIASALTVNGTLNMNSGASLSIHGIALNVNGPLTGSGMFMVNSSSSLIVNTQSSVTAPIKLTGANIGNFTVNVGSGNTVSLGSDLTVAGTLNMQSGTLVLSNYNMFVMGDIAASGSGLISSTASSNVTISTATSPSGVLAFSSTGNVVNNLTVSVGGLGKVVMGSDVIIQGMLNFTSGYISTGSYNVQVAASGSIKGMSSTSYVITAPSGQLTLNVSTSSTATYPVGTGSYYFPASISLNAGSPSGTVGVNVSQGVYSQGTTGVDISANQPLVNATWLFETNISSGLNYSMVLSWPSSAEVNGFMHVSDYIAHYTAGNWDVNTFSSATASGSGMFSLQRNNLSSMSPFAVFDSSTSPSGVNEIADNNQFQVYPNPASDNIYVKNTFTSGELVYADIVNICGQTISTTRMENSSITTIPVKNLVTGVYFIRLYNDHMNIVEKFIKAE